MNGLFECTLPHHHLLFPSWPPLLFPSTLLSVVRPNLESSRIASFHSTLPVLLLTFPTFYSYSSLLRYLLLQFRLRLYNASGTCFLIAIDRQPCRQIFPFFFPPKKEEEEDFSLENHLISSPFDGEFLLNIASGLLLFASFLRGIWIFHNAVEIKFHGYRGIYWVPVGLCHTLDILAR